MDALRLINLGYLSYVNYLINDMDSMREYLAKSVSIMVESLSVLNSHNVEFPMFGNCGNVVQFLWIPLEISIYRY